MPATEALLKLAERLRCPTCSAKLQAQATSLACSAGHSFDIARQGYVNLLTQPAGANADTAAMVLSRERFLSEGHYQPIREQISGLVGDARWLLEVGAGTGYYLSGCLSEDSWGLAADISAAACKRASRCHPQIAAVVADTWAGLPIREAAFDAVLCVFAPRNPAEFARLLTSSGRLIVAVPGPKHLHELRLSAGLLGIEEAKLERLRASLGAHFVEVSHSVVEYSLRLNPKEVSDLVGMGPNAFHQREGSFQGQSVTVQVHCLEFARRR